MHFSRAFFAGLLAALSLIVTASAAGAAAAPPVGQPPHADASPKAALAKLLGATRGTKARTGLGLPTYRRLLGKKWAKKVRRADASLAAKLAPLESVPRRAAKAVTTPTSPADDPLGITDKIRGKIGRQTRNLRIAAATDTGCPVADADGNFEFTGRARGEYVITTVERVGRYDITTTLVFEARFTAHAGVTRYAQVDGIFGDDGGTVSVTRSQVARDRRTGKSRKTGPTQRTVEALSPLLILDGAFDEFINRQDDDESPAPSRPLTSNALRDSAQGFVAMLYLALDRDFKAAETRMRTPDACVTVTADVPERLAPAQALEITFVPRQTQGNASTEHLLRDAHTEGTEWINYAGQSTDLLLGDSGDLAPGKPWYRFHAPATAWREDQPAGFKLNVVTRSGIATASVAFKPLDDKLYFKVVDVSGSVDATDVKTVSGSCTFTGTAQHVEVTPGSAAAPIGNLEGGFGHVETPLTYTRGAYSTLHACEGGEPTACDFGVEAVPGQNLGINLRQGEDGVAKLSWSGIAVQLGHSGCSLQVPDLYWDRDLLVSSVPVAKLQGTEPFRVENSGTQEYDVKQGISTMTGKLRWNFQMTLQRVHADGSPL